MTERRKTELDGLKSGWMGDLPADFADELLAMGQWQLVPGGEVLYGHGAESRDLFGIANGSLHMRIAMNEHEQRLAHICGPGFWFGENELISGSARILETEAAEAQSRASPVAALLLHPQGKIPASARGFPIGEVERE